MAAQILLVEDDATARLILSTVLERNGYKVTSAPNGEAAITLLGQSPFDTVITDLCMDGVDGLEVLRATRDQPHPPPVILLTGYPSHETEAAAKRLGVYGYRLKSGPVTELLEGVAAAVAEHHRQGG